MAFFREGPKHAVGLLRIVILYIHMLIDIFGAVNIMLLFLHVCCGYIAIFPVAYLLHMASYYNPIKIGRCVSNRRGPADGT